MVAGQMEGFTAKQTDLYYLLPITMCTCIIFINPQSLQVCYLPDVNLSGSSSQVFLFFKFFNV